MNYSVYLTILPVFTIFLAVLTNQSEGRLMLFSDLYNDTLFDIRDCDEDLDVYKPNTNGQWPAKIINPNHETITYEHPNRGRRMKLKITWESDIRNVKGFKILLKPFGEPEICRVLDFTHMITNSSSGVYLFQFNLSEIENNIEYTAELSPLPNRNKNAVSTLVFNTVDCSLFAPKLLTEAYDGKHLLVIFYKGPSECKFMKYEVSLYENGTEKQVTSKAVPTQDNVDRLQAFFKKKINKGYHFILARVLKDDNNSCPCRGRNGHCYECISRKSKRLLHLVPAKSGIPHAEKKPKNNTMYYVVVIGLMISTATVLKVIHWTLSVHLTMKKRGIVLLLDDHELHTSAVTKVVDYLNECHLNVHLASAFLRDHYIPDQMVVIAEVLKSDFVLLILSSALQKRMEAWDKQQDYVEFFKERNSNILTKPFLEVLLGSSNLYACKFDHVTEFGSWPKPCYSLPSDLTRMVAELNGQSFSQRSILCNCLKSNALRDKLQIAIEKTLMYEKSHANWFLKKYLCPSNVAVSHFIVDETSIDQSEHTNAPKLKEIFTGYKNTFISLPEDTTIAPSIYSERLEEINKRNQ